MSVDLHTWIFRRHNASHSFKSGMMTADSQGVYTETVVCTDGCGSRKITLRMKKNPTGVHIFLLVSFFFWCDLFCIDIDSKIHPQLNHVYSTSSYMNSRFPHLHWQPVHLLSDLTSFLLWDQEPIALLDFRHASLMCVYCMQPDNIIQAGLCLNRRKAPSCSLEKHTFLSESHSPVCASLCCTWFMSS